jgi:hypothetical protein
MVTASRPLQENTMEYMICFREPASEFGKRDDLQAARPTGRRGPHTSTPSTPRASRAATAVAARTAAVVRVVDGQRQVQDGLSADAREQLGGYFILRSTRWTKSWRAARAPCASSGSVEVRPVPPPPCARSPRRRRASAA